MRQLNAERRWVPNSDNLRILVQKINEIIKELGGEKQMNEFEQNVLKYLKSIDETLDKILGKLRYSE